MKVSSYLQFFLTDIIVFLFYFFNKNAAGTAPPNFSQRLQSMTARQGSQVRLDVRVTGIPTPVVKFYRDGVEIKSSPDFKIVQEGDLYSLIIAEAYPEDSGTYSVNATNNVGRATSTAELLIQGNRAKVAGHENQNVNYSGAICTTSLQLYQQINL